jgi:hypothetical protein
VKWETYPWYLRSYVSHRTGHYREAFSLLNSALQEPMVSSLDPSSEMAGAAYYLRADSADRLVHQEPMTTRKYREAIRRWEEYLKLCNRLGDVCGSRSQEAQERLDRLVEEFGSLFCPR